MTRSQAAAELRSILYQELYTARAVPRYASPRGRSSEIDLVYKVVPETLREALHLAVTVLEEPERGSSESYNDSYILSRLSQLTARIIALEEKECQCGCDAD